MWANDVTLTFLPDQNCLSPQVRIAVLKNSCILKAWANFRKCNELKTIMYFLLLFGGKGFFFFLKNIFKSKRREKHFSMPPQILHCLGYSVKIFLNLTCSIHAMWNSNFFKMNYKLKYLFILWVSSKLMKHNL